MESMENKRVVQSVISGRNWRSEGCLELGPGDQAGGERVPGRSGALHSPGEGEGRGGGSRGGRERERGQERG